jgi:hypothetical protein
LVGGARSTLRSLERYATALGCALEISVVTKSRKPAATANDPRHQSIVTPKLHSSRLVDLPWRPQNALFAQTNFVNAQICRESTPVALLFLRIFT